MPHSSPGWTRHLVYRAECARPTWKLRLGLLAVTVLALWLTGGWWTVSIGRSLMCAPALKRSDAILIENFDPDFELFQRARVLRAEGLAPLVLVPIRVDASGALNAVSQGVAELMARLSRVGAVEFVPIREVEPISLSAARDVRQYLVERRVRSVTVVTPAFRSRRSELVYRATLTPSGITVHCQPVGGDVTPETWTQTWHGIQRAAEHWLKLQYYRLNVLPFHTKAVDDAVAVSSR